MINETRFSDLNIALKKGISLFTMMIFIFFGSLAFQAQASESRWRIVTQRGSNALSGLEYEFTDENFIHYFLLLMAPNNEEITKIVYSMRLKTDMSAPEFMEGAVAFSLDQGEHWIINYRTKPMTNHKKYASCIQAVESEVFNDALLKRFRALFAAMKNKPIDRKDPKSIAALYANNVFQELREEALNQIRRLRPTAEAAYDSFVFSNCEKGKSFVRVLKESKLVEDPDLEVAELRSRSGKVDLVNPYYMDDFIVQNAEKMKKKGYVFEIDLMGLVSIMDSVTNEVTFRGAEPVVWVDSNEKKVATADFFVTSIKIPIMNWFMDIENIYGVNTESEGPRLILTDYMGEDDTRLIFWPAPKNL